MHYQQQRDPDRADRVPARFAIDHTVFPKHKKWVGEDLRSYFKVDAAMFRLVGSVLVRVPFEMHCVIHYV